MLPLRGRRWWLADRDCGRCDHGAALWTQSAVDPQPAASPQAGNQPFCSAMRTASARVRAPVLRMAADR
jgi:hypothetical protein